MSHAILNDAPFVLGVIINLLTMYLVASNTRQELREYRKLLIIFLVSDLYFTTIQHLLQPAFIVSGDLFLVYSPNVHNNILLAIYCGCVSMSFPIFSFHFVYRAFAISRNYHYVTRLHFKKLIIICSAFLAENILYSLACYFEFSYEPWYEPSLNNYFKLINHTSPVNPSTEVLAFRARKLDSSSIAFDKVHRIVYGLSLMFISLICIIVSSIYVMKHVSSTMMSESSRKLHKLLFVALVVSIPAVLLYLPGVVLLLSPFFAPPSFTTPHWAATALCTVYPILDPLAIVLMIGDYRRAFLRMGKRRIASVATSTTSSSSLGIVMHSGVAMLVEMIRSIFLASSFLVFLKFVLPSILQKISRGKTIHEKKWKKDIVYLYQMPGTKSMPSVSPFCIKVETFLRLHKIPFERRVALIARGENGKVPFIELNGDQIADSNLIISKLVEHFQIKEYANEQEANIGHAISSMVDFRTFNIFVHYKTTFSKSIFVEAILGKSLPKMLVNFFNPVVGELLRSEMHSRVDNTIGKFTNDQFDELAKKDLETYRGLIGDKKYLFGDGMTTRRDAISVAKKLQFPEDKDPVSFWREHYKLFPRLAKVARVLLAIPPSSIDSERLFSSVGLVANNRLRTRTTSYKMKKLAFVGAHARRQRIRFRPEEWEPYFEGDSDGDSDSSTPDD